MKQKFVKSIKDNINSSLNLNSELKFTFIESILYKAKNEMKKEVIEWIKILGSAGKVK